MSIVERVKALTIYAFGFTLIWNVLDFLYSTFITRSGYHFGISSDMITPLLLMLTVYFVQMSLEEGK